MKELGLDTIDVMRSIKKGLDPYWLMNPGKIFEATRLDQPNDSKAAAASTRLKTPNNENPNRIG